MKIHTSIPKNVNCLIGYKVNYPVSSPLRFSGKENFNDWELDGTARLNSSKWVVGLIKKAFLPRSSGAGIQYKYGWFPHYDEGQETYVVNRYKRSIQGDFTDTANNDTWNGAKHDWAGKK